jgi:hypothetical protein
LPPPAKKNGKDERVTPTKTPTPVRSRKRPSSLSDRILSDSSVFNFVEEGTNNTSKKLDFEDPIQNDHFDPLSSAADPLANRALPEHPPSSKKKSAKKSAKTVSTKKTSVSSAKKSAKKTYSTKDGRTFVVGEKWWIQGGKCVWWLGELVAINSGGTVVVQWWRANNPKKPEGGWSVCAYPKDGSMETDIVDMSNLVYPVIFGDDNVVGKSYRQLPTISPCGPKVCVCVMLVFVLVCVCVLMCTNDCVHKQAKQSCHTHMHSYTYTEKEAASGGSSRAASRQKANVKDSE